VSPLAAGAGLFALGALLGADQVAGPQWMLAQPVVAGALGGLACGQPQLGLLVGVWMQLAWNGAVPVGSRPTPDTSGGVLAGVVAGSQLLPAEGPLRAAVAGLLVALLAGWAGIWPAFWNRRLNARWTAWALAGADEAHRARRVEAAQRWAWLAAAALSGAWVLLAAVAGTGLGRAVLRWIPDSGGRGGALVALGWGLGVGGALLTFRGELRRDWAWLVGGAAAAGALKLAGAY